MKVDTERRRETPEGVNLSLRPAGPPVRMVAWAVDASIIATVQIVAATILALLGELGTGVMLLIAFGLWWFYPVVFEVRRRGATPGKAIVGLQVVHDDGTPIGFSASVLRNLLRFADLLPFAYAAGLVSMLMSRDFQRLGDLAAGTLVIYREDEALERQIPEAPPSAPLLLLERREQRAVLDFGARYPSWSEERRSELASIASAVTGSTGKDGARKLLGVANWLSRQEAAR